MPLTNNLCRAENWFTSDNRFNSLYHPCFRNKAVRHWTPLAVAAKAADFLAAGGSSNILDIGCGVGKFCLAAAHFAPGPHYYGVDQREDLIAQAEKAKATLSIAGVDFIHGNFTQLRFKDFDHFYFYNSFYENLSGTDKIDGDFEYSLELFNQYNYHLYKQLDKKPAGTRLATFHSLEDEVPASYITVGSDFDNLLKFWVKL